MTVLSQFVRVILFVTISSDPIITFASDNLSSIFSPNNMKLGNSKHDTQMLMTQQTKLHNKMVNNIQSASHKSLPFNIPNNNGDHKRSTGHYISRIIKPLKKNEQTVRKALLGKASSIELMQSTIEAKQSLQTAVTIRDEALKAIEKILNMAM